jgi:hypothetical protein
MFGKIDDSLSTRSLMPLAIRLFAADAFQVATIADAP